MTGNTHPSMRAGLLAWTVTVLIGASWQLATRFGVTTTLTPIDLALLRYVIPAVALLPILFRRGFLPTSVPPWIHVLIVGGGGLPFGLLGMAGAQFAPASHMGALLPGSMPIFVALLSVLILGERFGKGRIIGLGVIVIGVVCVVAAALSGPAGGPSVLFGDTLFIVAGVFWAVYTVAYRKSGLDPWHGAALICFWSAVLIVPIWVIMPNTALLSAPLADIALQVVAQGHSSSRSQRRCGQRRRGSGFHGPWRPRSARGATFDVDRSGCCTGRGGHLGLCRCAGIGARVQCHEP